MPSLQEIEQLKTILNELADEPEVQAQRGEEIEDLPPPGEDNVPVRAEGRGALAGAEAPPVIAPDEGFDATAMIASDDELEALDSFEDFDFEQRTAGGKAQAAGPGAAPPEFPTGAPTGPEAELWGEAAEESQEPAEPTEPTEPTEIPTMAASEAESVEPAPEEDVLAALGLTEEAFALEETPAEPGAEAQGAGIPEGEIQGVVEESLAAEEIPGFELPVAGEPETAEAEGEADEFGIPPGLIGPEDQGEAAPLETEEGAEPEGFEMPVEFGQPESFELPEEFTLPELEQEKAPQAVSEEEAPEEAFAFPEEALVSEEAPAEEAPEEAFAFPEEAPVAEEAAAEPFDFTEELGDMEGLFPAGEEQPSEEQASEEQALEEEALQEQIPAGEEARAEWAPGEEALEPSAFGEEPFELPEEFRTGEEPGAGAPTEEAPPVFEEGEAAFEAPGEEEAEFLRALQEEIAPGAVEERGEAAPLGEHVDLEAAVEKPQMEVSEGEELAFDEFSLEGLAEEFGLPEGGQQQEERLPAEAETVEIPTEIPQELQAKIAGEAPPVAAAPVEVPGRAPEEEAAVPGGFGLSDRHFAALRRTLGRLPRNLKIAVEELIGERELAGEDLRTLVGLLVDGAASTAVAAEVSRITGTRIRIPKSYEKLTGLEFEAERRTFAYAFRENILPILRIALLSLGVVVLLSFLGYRYVYRPVQAQILYRQGYNQIDKQRYQLADERFDQALTYWVFKGWFYRYAEAFRTERQYTLAADKYEQLLRRFPLDRKGSLDYAGLLTVDLAGYERADELMRGLLEKNLKDYEALLARGDNFLEWAAEATPQEAPSLYEEARFQYASIIDYYGQRDEVLLRMMRYFIRTNKRQQTRDLKEYLEGSSLRRVSPALYAAVYAELAGYWMDKGEYDGIADMLFDAMEAEVGLPEVHYNLARYQHQVGNTGEEARALNVTLQLLENTQPLTKRRLYMLIDAYRRYGEAHWRRQEYLEAERNFEQAIDRIEELQRQRIFGPEEMFGQVYEDQGDILYYVSRDLNGALDHYLTAAVNGHRPSRLDYKVGYVYYTREDFEEALLRFSNVVDQNPRNGNALFALGNALYLGGFFSSAQGYYLRLLDLLETRRERIPLLLINENPEHRALVEAIMKTYNNLGVTLYRLGIRSRDPAKESGALVNLTFSSENFDQVSRDPETAARGITRNLAYLNQRGILYPESGFQPQIYVRIPIDLEAQGF
jgi:tetratricopeptide (TPR) repeat protein